MIFYAIILLQMLGASLDLKVFISWSGGTSKAIAEAIYCWLPQVIQSITPWMSTEDISAGTRWSAAIAGELETAHFGIICVTPDNVNAPWLQFEAGALSKTLANAFVCPYIFGLHPSELKGPLAQFQAVLRVLFHRAVKEFGELYRKQMS
ncbi:MAG: toll/interleukin-1 receptor domain-containing protein [Candidatus Angelobacter sp.]